LVRIRRTPRAAQDLEEIWLHVARENPDAADSLLDALETRLVLLADHPMMGPARSDVAPDMRYHPVGQYLLLNRIVKGGIELVRVLHGARDLLRLLHRRVR
jgi:toxin ParE1/3/4